ncbi:hypothetical protein [Streptomyces niger]|uniref:hypothetical protein n=1 Tax=Streptomyces niger TaxID=66373 RepID=UPI000A5A7E2A|nr:hypothetical protein [Streptomyces niger]
MPQSDREFRVRDKNELEHVRLDLAASYASLAESGARTVAVRLDIAGPPEQ